MTISDLVQIYPLHVGEKRDSALFRFQKGTQLYQL